MINAATEIYLRYLISERCSISVLIHEQKTYEQILKNMKTLKLRQKANNGFQKWLARKTKSLNESIRNAQLSLNQQTDVYSSKIQESLDASQGFQYQSYKSITELGVEKLRVKCQKMDIYEEIDYERQFKREFEMKYWRLQSELNMLQNELEALAPHQNLWESARVDAKKPKP